MLLLPDQTYEESKDQKSSVPIKALKNLLSNTKLEPHITKIDSDEKISFDNSKAKSIKNVSNTTNDVHSTEAPKVHTSKTEDFEKVSEFFNNIPEFIGEPLGPFSIEDAKDGTKTDADLLKECERFLNKYRIKPEFFCRYRKKLDLSQVASVPVSWPDFSVANKTSEKRKPQSASPPRQSSVMRMKRFQKSTAIYTLPARGATKRAGNLSHASSSNEAVHLQQRLKSLSSELVTLRNRLHVSQTTGEIVPNTLNKNIVTAPNGIPNATMSKTHPMIVGPPIMPTGNSQRMHHKAHQVATDSKQQGGNAVPVASSRNTSIPHPLPHHITTKNHETTSNAGVKALPRRILNETTTEIISIKPRIITPKYTATSKNILPKDMDDLIHLQGPLTEDAVMRILHARFEDGKYFTNVGPILLSINPYLDVGNPLTLSSTRSLELAPQFRRIVSEAVRQQAETGFPQAIILSGASGAGKTHCSMLLLRQLFAVIGGGPETDAFKHLAAAFTVLRSLGSAKTTTNSEASRIGQFIEVQVTDGALYRTKIHCYFLDQTRVVRPLPNEKNYHIFYQMLAGLSRDERIKLNLVDYSTANLRYLQNADIQQDETEDATRFQEWKTCLGILGIPFLDVVRVLAAVLLLGNVQFIDGKGLEVGIKGKTELNSVSLLLGVSAEALFRGLTTRTHNARGQLVKSVCDANMSNMTRDSLAKALYCRTVATIVRRANTLKRLGSTLGTLSSDSNESVHNKMDDASQHASTIGGKSGSKSMAALNNAVRHATDGFIGILDMFGFEEPKPALLEHLCINLCAETMQHFYNTHIFKSSVDSCRDEGIMCDTDIDYVDNVPCIDLISSLRTGLLSMLDAECAVRGTAESYVAKIKVQHRNSSRLESKQTDLHGPRAFTIRHFAGRVEYDTTEFLDTNRDVISDDLVSVFYKQTCGFGFVSHLFGSELKALYAHTNVPRGLSFRIAPKSHADLLNGVEPVSTLTQDFHTRLDNLLRTLVHARPHFVRCIRCNATETSGKFERQTIVKQIRSLQVLETVNLMSSGFPHRMRFKLFTARYRMLAPFKLLRKNDEKALEDCKLILHNALEKPPEIDVSITMSWAPGKRHIFLSEGLRQYLEKLRTDIRVRSATLIQAVWRGWQVRRRFGSVKRKRPQPLSSLANVNVIVKNSANRPSTSTNNISKRPKPIAGTPPPDPNVRNDSKIITKPCNLYGLDLKQPPPIPSPRQYTVVGNAKLKYPQFRIMKISFSEDASLAKQLQKGKVVKVIGASPKRGHLIVNNNGTKYHVPFQYMKLVKNAPVTAKI